MFIAYNCNGCSATRLTQYKNNEIYQHVTPEKIIGQTLETIEFILI